MAAASKGARRGLISRTLERCRSGLAGGGRAAGLPVAGCFSVYVGPERERFVVRAECANHPLFQRLLDDAEREYGYAAQGPLALPCDVGAFLDVLWQVEHDDDDDEAAGLASEVPMAAAAAAAAASPMCGLRCGSGSVKGYHRMLSPARTTTTSLSSRSSPAMAGRRR